MSIVIVSSTVSFNLDNSMFVVEGSYCKGYVYNKDVFFMLGLKEDQDYCFVGARSYIASYRLRVGGDSFVGKYEAVLFEDTEVSKILQWIYKSIASYLFKTNRESYDLFKSNAKPIDLLPELENEFGFYMPDKVLEDFIVTFSFFKPIDV